MRREDVINAGDWGGELATDPVQVECMKCIRCRLLKQCEWKIFIPMIHTYLTIHTHTYFYLTLMHSNGKK